MIGFPFMARYVVVSGNMPADFRCNVTAESQGRLQACRLYELSQDRGVRDKLHVNVAPILGPVDPRIRGTGQAPQPPVAAT